MYTCLTVKIYLNLIRYAFKINIVPHIYNDMFDISSVTYKIRATFFTPSQISNLGTPYIPSFKLDILKIFHF